MGSHVMAAWSALLQRFIPSARSETIIVWDPRFSTILEDYITETFSLYVDIKDMNAVEICAAIHVN
jgi:hypothetical protein